MSGPDITLSERQLEVALRVASDASAKEIARELNISAKTVEKHMAEAARRIQAAEPGLALSGSPRRIIRGYYVYIYGTIAFEQRLSRRAA